MRTIFVENYEYKGDLATVLTSVELLVSNQDFERFEMGAPVSELEARITAHSIEILERRAAAAYFEANYPKALAGDYEPTAREIRSIIALFGINRQQVASLLAIDKGTLSNHINGKRKMERSTAFFLLERLGHEIAMPGALRAIVEGLDDNPPVRQQEMQAKINGVRYTPKRVA